MKTVLAVSVCVFLGMFIVCFMLGEVREFASEVVSLGPWIKERAIRVRDAYRAYRTKSRSVDSWPWPTGIWEGQTLSETFNQSIYRHAQTKPLTSEIERFAYDIELVLQYSAFKDNWGSYEPWRAALDLRIASKALIEAVEKKSVLRIRHLSAVCAALNLIISHNTKAIYGQPISIPDARI